MALWGQIPASGFVCVATIIAKLGAQGGCSMSCLCQTKPQVTCKIKKC